MLFPSTTTKQYLYSTIYAINAAKRVLHKIKRQDKNNKKYNNKNNKGKIVIITSE